MSRAPDISSMAEVEKAAAAWVFRREAGLTPEEEAAFARWLSADPRHTAAWGRHTRAWSALDRPQQAGQADILLKRLAERATRRRRRRLVGTVSMVSFLLLGAVAIWQTTRSPENPIVAPQALVILPEKRTLADGSVVELEAGAKIDIDFSGPWRHVALLEGGAHFQVKKDERPFVVAVANVAFRAVGTAFAVQVASTQVELLVTEGRVAVQPAPKNPSTDPLASVSPPPATSLPLATVEAGSRMVVGQEDMTPILAPTPVSPAEMAERLAWRIPKLEFTDTPLAEAVALMNEYSQVQLVIDDAELARLPISGLFRAERTEAFVRLLEANFSVEAERVSETVRLRLRR